MSRKAAASVRVRRLAAGAGAGVVALSSLAFLADTAHAAEVAAAAERGDRAAVGSLLATDVGERAVDTPSKDGMTALLWAAQADDLALVEMLLDAGADANLGNRYGVTPLWLAATNRSAAVAKRLLARGADPKAAMPHGETALMAAARAGAVEVVELLLAAGADPNAHEKQQGETALIWAAAENHADAIRALVAGGADPDRHSRALNLAPMEWVQIGMVSTVLPVGGWTALMYAARQNHKAAVRALVDVGADLDAQDADGTTALVIAIINQHYDLAAELLEAGGDPNVADRTGMTALYAAVDMAGFRSDIGRPNVPRFDRLGARDIVRLALAHGADPNAQLSSPIIGRHHGMGDFALGKGATALMRAAKGGDLETMRLLLEAGADPQLAMANGQTVFALVQGGRRGQQANPAALALLDEFARDDN